MKEKETNKKNNELKVLAAAAVVTAVTMAGSTFAWMTSKDEVTNRLAIKSSYRTAIYETDFEPPTNWEIGQTVDKNVSIVNSGNIDAIVKVSLGGTAKMTYWGTGETNETPNDNEYRKLNMSEVIAIEAGGRLVTTTVTEKEYSNCSTADPYEFKSIVTTETTVTTGTFTEAGYYIFKRSDGESTDNTDKPVYSGYYCDGSGNYYALYTKVVNPTKEGENTVISLELDDVKEEFNQITNYKLMKKDTASAQTVELDYDYTKVNSDKKITVNLKKNENDTTPLATFEIALANIGSSANQWTYIDDNNNGSFYYNNDLESDSTNNNDKTSQLIDSVKFVKANAYFENLVYNLNISHESVQVVIGADNKEFLPGAEEVQGNTVQPFNDGVNATASYAPGNDKEISSISWAEATVTESTE